MNILYTIIGILMLAAAYIFIYALAKSGKGN